MYKSIFYSQEICLRKKFLPSLSEMANLVANFVFQIELAYTCTIASECMDVGVQVKILFSRNVEIEIFSYSYLFFMYDKMMLA